MTDSEKARIAKAKYNRQLSKEARAVVEALSPEDQQVLWASIYDSDIPGKTRKRMLERNEAIIRAVVPEAPEEERAALPFKESEQTLRPSFVFGSARNIVEVLD